MTTSSIRNKRKKIIVRTLVALFWIAAWQVLCLFLDNDLLIASPFSVIRRIFELLFVGEFWVSVLNSLLRILEGYLLGAVLGILCAALGALFPFFSALLSPVITITKTAPVTSFVILALVWIKSYNLAIFISFLMVFPMIYSGVREGIESADPKLLEVAKVYHFPVRKTLRLIYYPAIKPFLLTGLSTAIGFGWKAGITGEIFALPKHAIGTRLYESKIYLETLDVFAWTAVIILLSLLIEKLIRLMLKRMG